MASWISWTSGQTYHATMHGKYKWQGQTETWLHSSHWLDFRELSSYVTQIICARVFWTHACTLNRFCRETFYQRFKSYLSIQFLHRHCTVCVPDNYIPFCLLAPQITLLFSHQRMENDLSWEHLLIETVANNFNYMNILKGMWDALLQRLPLCPWLIPDGKRSATRTPWGESLHLGYGVWVYRSVEN